MNKEKRKGGERGGRRREEGWISINIRYHFSSINLIISLKVEGIPPRDVTSQPPANMINPPSYTNAGLDPGSPRGTNQNQKGQVTPT